MRKTVVFIVIILLISAGCKKSEVLTTPENSSTSTTPTSQIGSTSPTSVAPATPSPVPVPSQPSNNANIVLPISDAAKRITKKFFGTYVTPKNSPVFPEKFTGYHTGLDFETFPEEKDTDVPIKAICTGPLLQKRTATGYGGVAVQKCTINDQPATIVYGHLRLSSITPKVNDQLKAGDTLGVLGTGYTPETDGERKHLHLDIHKGSAINIKGYVQSKGELGDWVDPRGVLGL